MDLDLSRVLSSFYRKYELKWAEIRELKIDGKRRYVYTDATPAEQKRGEATTG